MQTALRSTRKSLVGVAPLLGAVLLLFACGPSPTPNRSSGGNVEGARPAQKTLTILVQDEPVSVVLFGKPGEGGSTSARYDRYFIFHGNLTLFDKDNNPAAAAAVKVPRVEDGDWTVNPDQTMEVTWKIRPDVYWHDGTPLTSADFTFGFDVVRDPNLAVPSLGELLNISSVRAVDDKTLIVNWKTISVNANTNSTEGIPAMPRHQLEALYQAGDAEAFAASPAWRTEFIGLGPYRITQLVQGSLIEAQAFDAYYLGRPKIDRLLINWVPDTNVMVARLLSGAADVVLRQFKPEQMVEVQKQWGTTGGRAFPAFNDIRSALLNFRDPNAPWARDVRFRQAMLYALDRQQLVDVFQLGYTQLAYFPSFPEFPIYQLADQRGLPKYPYDPTRAQQLFAAAGWNKGPDGLLHDSVGQTVHFFCCRYATVNTFDMQEGLAWSADWKAAGIDTESPLPGAPAGLSTADTRKAQNLAPWGGAVGNWRITADQSWATLVKANVTSDESRWAGINSGAWVNPSYEDFFTRAQSTLNVAQRLDIEFQMMTIIMNELPVLPAYYNPGGNAVRAGVEGVNAGAALNRGSTTEIHLWDIKF